MGHGHIAWLPIQFSWCSCGERENINMTNIGKSERVTQNRLVKLFCDELAYRYLCDWADRAANSNIEDIHPSEFLTGRMRLG